MSHLMTSVVHQYVPHIDVASFTRAHTFVPRQHNVSLLFSQYYRCVVRILLILMTVTNANAGGQGI